MNSGLGYKAGDSLMYPISHSYKANTASVETIVVDEDTGEEKKRLINRMRWKGFGPIAVSYTEKNVRTVIGVGFEIFNWRYLGARKAVSNSRRAAWPS